MLTQCTNPDAPWYYIDLIAISFMEAYSFDLPCNIMVGIGASTLFLIYATLASLAFYSWYRVYKA